MKIDMISDSDTELCAYSVSEFILNFIYFFDLVFVYVRPFLSVKKKQITKWRRKIYIVIAIHTIFKLTFFFGEFSVFFSQSPDCGEL